MSDIILHPTIDTEKSKETTDTHEHPSSNGIDIFGFWVYIMTDCVLFSALFATFAVLHNNTFGDPSLKTMINLPYAFEETLLLLTSNLTFGMAILCLYKEKVNQVVAWLVPTFLFGLGFVIMEVHEFVELVHRGDSWHANGAMSSFFTLVGTHGIHVSIGLAWILVMILQISIFKVTPTTRRRMTYLGLFWNFLDIVWIFLFTIVYLMGAI